MTDNKRFLKTIKPLLSDRFIQSSATTLISNKVVTSGDFKLAQTFNNYFKSTECEVSSNIIANFRSKYGFGVAI